jgi:nicotinate-nucleotide pyrophosphorylase (carboxylating)
VVAAVTAALEEDLGLAGDITTDATIPAAATASAVFAVRKPGVVAGLQVAEAAFKVLDPAVSFEVLVPDGTFVDGARTPVARVVGNARAILSAERVALNYVCRMSGIATLTRRYVEAVAHTDAKIIDTRKTTPGLRAFEKYAVRAGGGMNHRVGLFDAVLVKDNHIAVAGGIAKTIAALRSKVGHLVKIQVEVDNLRQLEELLTHNIDAVLFDNMGPKDMAEGVKIVAGRLITEASGGVNLDSVREIAEAGVDVISSGALTHSAPILDLGLDVEIAG